MTGTDGLLAEIAACNARRLELLAEIKANSARYSDAVRALEKAVGQQEAARLLGVSRQQVWRLVRGR